MKIFKNFFQNFIQNRWRSNTPTSPVGMGWGYVGGVWWYMWECINIFFYKNVKI